MIRYAFTLECERVLSDDDQAEMQDALESQAASVLCDLRGGDSGDVRVRFVPSRTQDFGVAVGGQDGTWD